MNQFFPCFIFKCLLVPSVLPCVDSSISMDGVTVQAVLSYTNLFPSLL